MESIGGNELRSETRGSRSIGIGLDGYQLTEEFQSLMTGPPISGNSFTALLELPANQAMEILHSSATDESRLSACDTALPCNRTLDCASTFLCNTAIERASKYSVFPNGDSSGDSRSGGGGQVSPEASSTPSDSSANVLKLKCEPADNSSNPNSSTQVSDSTSNDKTMKRKEREKKGKNSSKKSKKAAEENLEDGEKLPYVHVRARRGQATDSHSLAERARRGKINARMKLLQELVPGCHKISGTALMLDEIINHVQSLQHQVEYLSMKLATVDPRINFNLDRLFMAGNGSVMDSNILDSVHPLACPDPQINGERQPCQQQWGFDSLHQSAWPRDRDHHSFITPHNSLLSYNTSSNSASLSSGQLKMEL